MGILPGARLAAARAPRSRRRPNPRRLRSWHPEADMRFTSPVPAVLLAALLGDAACAVAPLRTAPPAAAVTPPAGQVGVVVLPDAGGRKPRPDAGETFHAPQPVDTPLPSYPIGALMERAAPARIAVRIVIGRDGRVEKISDSPVEPSSAGPFAAEFSAAVENALRQWRFVPAMYRRLRPGGDLDGDGIPDWQDATESRAVEVYYDLRFTFEIVDGEGRVLVGGSRAPG